MLISHLFCLLESEGFVFYTDLRQGSWGWLAKLKTRRADCRERDLGPVLPPSVPSPTSWLIECRSWSCPQKPTHLLMGDMPQLPRAAWMSEESHPLRPALCQPGTHTRSWAQSQAPLVSLGLLVGERDPCPAQSHSGGLETVHSPRAGSGPRVPRSCPRTLRLSNQAPNSIGAWCVDHMKEGERPLIF